MSAGQIPLHLMCPIGLEIMTEPVICDDGHTYEKKNILALPGTISPVTNLPINKSILIPNHAIMYAIAEFLKNEKKEDKNRQKDIQLKITMSYFNSKMPFVSGGYIMYSNEYIDLCHTPLTQIKLTIENILQIKKIPIDVLYNIYKNLKYDLTWIEKYVVGCNNQHPYVDYVFDYYIKLKYN